MSGPDPMLVLENIETYYGPIMAIRGVSLKVREGQIVEVNFPRRENLAAQKGSCARIKRARVIRVDRSEALSAAGVKVALAFCDQTAPLEAATVDPR